MRSTNWLAVTCELITLQQKLIDLQAADPKLQIICVLPLNDEHVVIVYNQPV